MGDVRVSVKDNDSCGPICIEEIIFLSKGESLDENTYLSHTEKLREEHKNLLLQKEKEKATLNQVLNKDKKFILSFKSNKSKVGKVLSPKSRITKVKQDHVKKTKRKAVRKNVRKKKLEKKETINN